MTNSTAYIGKNIAYYRKLKHLTQEKLSEMSGISGDYLSEIERGKKPPSLKRLFLIANALEIEAYKLLINNS